MFGSLRKQQYAVLGSAKASPLGVGRVAIAGLLASALWLLSTNNIAVADKIVIDGEHHDDVVIAIGESCYYVSFPKLGTTVSVSKSEVSSEDVLIESSDEKRSALFAEWKLANTRLKEQREEEKKKRELAALEKERLRAVAEKEKKKAEEVLAREQIRLEKEKLGVRAAKVLAGDHNKFAENLRQAEEAETNAITAELDELESELKRIVNQSADKSNVVIPERIKKRVEELAEMARERSKLNSKAQNAPGYSLEARKAAAISVLMDQGKSRSEAVGTVEDMLRNDMLPYPRVSGPGDDETNQYVYSASIRKTAAIETLIDNGWERSDAEIGVENMKQEDAVVNGKSEPIASDHVDTNSAETEPSPADHSKSSFKSEREPVDKSIEREVEENWTPRPGGNTKEDAAWVSRDFRNAKSWEELDEIVRFHDKNGR